MIECMNARMPECENARVFPGNATIPSIPYFTLCAINLAHFHKCKGKDAAEKKKIEKDKCKYYKLSD